MKTPPIAMIVAALQPNLGIGYKGQLPWRLKREIKYFKDVTSSAGSGINGVVMGRKTWELIPPKFRPLPGRFNVVLSRSHTNTQKDGVWLYNSFDKVLEDLAATNYTIGNKNVSKLFVIGGAEIYNLLEHDERVGHILLTEVEVSEKTPAPVMIDTWLKWDLKRWTERPVREWVTEETILVPDSDIVEGAFRYRYKYFKRT